MYVFICLFCFFFFKQKTAYEMRISDWSSDVCSSDLTISDWKALSEKEVKGRDLTWQTPEGIAVKPLYTAEDVKDIDSGLPGFGPFTRGVRGSMYAGQP